MLNDTNEMKMENQPIDCLTTDKKEQDIAFLEKVNVGMRESAMGIMNFKEDAKLILSRWMIINHKK